MVSCGGVQCCGVVGLCGSVWWERERGEREKEGCVWCGFEFGMPLPAPLVWMCFLLLPVDGGPFSSFSLGRMRKQHHPQRERVESRTTQIGRRRSEKRGLDQHPKEQGQSGTTQQATNRHETLSAR